MKKNRLFMPIIMLIMLLLNIYDIKAYYVDTSVFKPLDNSEKLVGHTDVGYWNNGGFFESVTYKIIGQDDSTGKMIVRFRHYITHKGEPGSYTYQAIPVGIYVDGAEIGRFTSQIGSHIYNETRFCGEQTVTLYSGNHLVELKDIGNGATTVVNMSKRIVVDDPIYTVTFKDWNNINLKSQLVYKGYNATAPANPSRTGYTFTGWDKSFTNVQSNLTVTAQYKINTYTVNFRDWNGTVLKSQTVNYGSTANPPANPSRTGYTFTGWNGSYNNVTSNCDVYATYTINYYTAFTNHWVEKDFVNGAWNPSGTLNSGETMIHIGTSNHQSIAYGGTYTPSPIDIVGYELSSNSYGYNGVNGWTGGTNGSSISIYQYTSVEFYYRKKNYTVSFNSNGGSSVSNQTIKYKNTASSPSSTKENFKLVGWYTDSALTKQFDFNTQITGNMTLYAKWERTHYDINISHKTYDTVNGWKDITNESKKLAINSTYTITNLDNSKIPLGYQAENKYDLYLNNAKVGSTLSITAKQIINGSFDTIVVRYAGTSPSITGKETYYFIGDDVSSSKLITRASASDIKDGNISNKIIVDKIRYADRTETKPSKLNTSKEQNITVTFSVTNSRGVTSVSDVTMHIVKKGSDTELVRNEATIYSRYISNETLVNGKTPVNMLLANSVWKTPAYANTLQAALNNDTPLSQYNYINSSDVEEYAKSKNPSEQANKDLINRFK